MVKRFIPQTTYRVSVFDRSNAKHSRRFEFTADSADEIEFYLHKKLGLVRYSHIKSTTKVIVYECTALCSCEYLFSGHLKLNMQEACKILDEL